MLSARAGNKVVAASPRGLIGGKKLNRELNLASEEFDCSASIVAPSNLMPELQVISISCR
jgi:hypothetical protein